jgi:Holliday junction resolvase RusA-like endonuclease
VEKRISLTLGAPISSNSMYVPSKKYGMVKSTKYRNWIEKNLPVAQETKKPTKFPVEIQVVIVEGKGFSDKNDIDNVLKSICDLLVKANVLPDDSTKYISKCEAKYIKFYSTRSEAITVINILEPE